MEEKDKKFAQTLFISEIIAIIFMILHSIYQMASFLISGFIFYGALIVLDGISIGLAVRKKTKLLIGLRFLEFVGLSAYIVFENSGVKEVTVISILLLCLRMIEIIFLFDYSDTYSRTITIGLMTFPIAICIIVSLVFGFKTEPGSIQSIGAICEVSIIVIIIANLSAIFTGWLTSIERRVFEQRRMADNAQEMNETLRIHQEKIKKANEELGIQRIRMETANRLVTRANIEIQTQNDILKEITKCRDLETLADETAKSIRNSMNLLFCAVMLKPVTKNTDCVYGWDSVDISDNFASVFKEELFEAGLSAILTKKTISLDKTLERNCYKSLSQDDPLQVVITVPLINEGKEEGVIFCGSRLADSFDEAVNFFENLSSQIILGIRNIQLYFEIQEMAIRDGLTGLYNRRHLNELIEIYSDEAIRNQIPLSAALVDIDHFKGFNDTYGHAFGDKVLIEISKVLENWADKYGGIAARYGGEEFVLAFLNCDSTRIEEVLNNAKHDIDSIVLDYEGKPVSIRVSIGFTSFPEISRRPSELLNRADSAMYYSKENGRNRITKDGRHVDDFLAERKERDK